MSIYLSKTLNCFKNIYKLNEEKSYYLDRLYENYTNFININLTKHKKINKSLKTALHISTIGIFLILSAGAVLIDTVNKMINHVSKIYQSFNNPTSKLKVIKEFSSESKEYIITVIALTTFITTSIVYKNQINSFYSYIKLYFTNENQSSIPTPNSQEQSSIEKNKHCLKTYKCFNYFPDLINQICISLIIEIIKSKDGLRSLY